MCFYTFTCVKNRKHITKTHLHVPGSFILIPDASEMIRNCCAFVSRPNMGGSWFVSYTIL